MIDILPASWEDREAEYNKNYDPYADVCPQCNKELEEIEDEEHLYCANCGFEVG